tara:strand:- start:412 stop:1845 length:1434 start_codon:yes stop_codon:yes gene_type:complete
MTIKKKIENLFVVIAVNSLFSEASSQDFINMNPTKMILRENIEYFNFSKLKKNDKDDISIKINYINKSYINTNLPNLENQNGLTLNKGYGTYHSYLIQSKIKNLLFSVEPQIKIQKEFKKKIETRENGLFSVLNDRIQKDNAPIIRNFNVSVDFKSLRLGYGNKNQWWGPGIHNSLIMTNNSIGFYNYYITNSNEIRIGSSLKINFKYMFSPAIKNSYNNNFYLTAAKITGSYRKLKLGISKSVLSGGYPELPWSINNAALVILSNKNNRYWDYFYDLFVQYDGLESGLKLFAEIAVPKRSFSEYNPKTYYDHSIASNIGFRKYGAFDTKYLMIGAEYTNLIQGAYYNLMPTPNWYSNKLYNYSSFNGKRWGAHSGSDSDDFLVIIGYLEENKSLIYGLNYERRGVTYNFPPEVKFESRISLTHRFYNLFIQITYENEHIRHYNFVDSNSNVWTEEFENGSIQNTKTILLSFEYKLL